MKLLAFVICAVLLSLVLRLVFKVLRGDFDEFYQEKRRKP